MCRDRPERPPAARPPRRARDRFSSRAQRAKDQGEATGHVTSSSRANPEGGVAPSGREMVARTRSEELALKPQPSPGTSSERARTFSVIRVARGRSTVEYRLALRPDLPALALKATDAFRRTRREAGGAEFDCRVGFFPS